MHTIDRRQILQLAGIGGAVFVTGAPKSKAATADADDFYIVQLSDSHWGFEGPPNPDARGTLPKAVVAVNALADKPDFIIFTGDLTHTSSCPARST